MTEITLVNARDKVNYQSPILWHGEEYPDELHRVYFTPREGWLISASSYYPEHHTALMALEEDTGSCSWNSIEDYDDWKDRMEYELDVSVCYEFDEIPFSSFRAAYGFLSAFCREISSPIHQYYRDYENALRKHQLKGYFTAYAPTHQLNFIEWNSLDCEGLDSDDEWFPWLEVYRKTDKILSVWYPTQYVKTDHLRQPINIKVQGYLMGELSTINYPWKHGDTGFSSKHLHPHIIDGCITLDDQYKGRKSLGYSLLWNKYHMINP